MIMGPRPDEGYEHETNFFIQCENEKDELSIHNLKDNTKVEGEQVLDAIGSKNLKIVLSFI